MYGAVLGNGETIDHRLAPGRHAWVQCAAGRVVVKATLLTVGTLGFTFCLTLMYLSMRSVMDVGNWSASRFVLLGGQSGNPCSPHYDDLVPLWQRGEGVPIHWEDAAVDAHTRHTLRLTPSGALP